MKFKKWIAIIGVLALLFPSTISFTFAKGGGGGGGFSGGGGGRGASSSSFSSTRSVSVTPSTVTKTTTSTWSGRSGGGYFKPTEPTKSAPVGGGYNKPAAPAKGTTQQAGQGYSKPVGPGGPALPAAPGAVKPVAQKIDFKSTSGFNKDATKQIQAQKSASGLVAYQAEKGKFKAPEQTFDKTKVGNNAIYTNRPVYSGYDANSHYTVRNNYYTTTRYVTPSYAYGFSPSYGVWDTLFLVWMMDNMSHNAEARAMAYNYRNDPGYQQWQAETRKKSDTDPALKQKVAEMDAQIKKMETEGVKTDSKYVPKDIPADVMLASQALQAKEVQKPDLVFATGAPGGFYQEFGKLLKRNANSVNAVLKDTTGSMENLKLLLAGQADMAIVQSDVMKKLEGTKMATEQVIIYPEFLQLVVNSKSGIKSVKDMSSGKCSVCMPKGSGTAASWDAMIEQDSTYAKIPVVNDTYGGCLARVQKDPNTAMFMVAGLNSPVMKLADGMDNLALAAMDDWDFNGKKDKNGNKIYDFHAIPSDTYKKLQSGFLWNHSVDTLTVNAVLVVRSDWVTKYGPEAFEALTFAFLETKDDINKMVNKR
jgi:TRAP transporter TAXI family solute receptor